MLSTSDTLGLSPKPNLFPCNLTVSAGLSNIKLANLSSIGPLFVKELCCVLENNILKPLSRFVKYSFFNLLAKPTCSNLGMPLIPPLINTLFKLPTVKPNPTKA